MERITRILPLKHIRQSKFGLSRSAFGQEVGLLEVLPNVKTNSWSIEGGRGCHSFALPVDYYRRLIVQRLMQTLVVVKLNIATQAVN